MKLEIKKIGNSTGVILPKELLAQLGLAQGDTLYVFHGRGILHQIQNRYREKGTRGGFHVFGTTDAVSQAHKTR